MSDAGLTGRKCVELLHAEFRQANHHRARLLAAVAETALCEDPDTTGRLPEPDEFAAAEVRAALRLTRAAADTLWVSRWIWCTGARGVAGHV